jgi:hypothetical protein
VIAEAVDAAISVGWALLAWIVLAAVFATAIGFALVVAAWAVARIVRRTVRAAMPRRTPSACAWRPWRRPTPLASVETPTEPPEARPALPVRATPAWARTDTEEAA